MPPAIQARAFGLADAQGVLLTALDPAGPAARAGLRAGDVVVSVDGRPVRRSSDLRNRVGLAALGATLAVDFVREGQRRTARVLLDVPSTGKAPAPATRGR